MVRNNEGLTKTYNRLNDPEEESADIVRLRQLHDAMDRAVLDAYRWTDKQPKCEFIAEFEDEDEEDENGRTRRKKYRYRWPDEVRDDVLAWLLELNRQRALEEGQVVQGEAATLPGPQPRKPSNKKPRTKQGERISTPGLFETESEET